MEIQKIFTDMEGKEVLYSVLMDEEELYFFSEIQREFNSPAQKARRQRFDIQQGIKASSPDIWEKDDFGKSIGGSYQKAQKAGKKLGVDNMMRLQKESEKVTKSNNPRNHYGFGGRTISAAEGELGHFQDAQNLVRLGRKNSAHTYNVTGLRNAINESITNSGGVDGLRIKDKAKLLEKFEKKHNPGLGKKISKFLKRLK